MASVMRFIAAMARRPTSFLKLVKSLLAHQSREEVLVLLDDDEVLTDGCQDVRSRFDELIFGDRAYHGQRLSRE